MAAAVDIFVAEVSGSSFGLGFESGRLLRGTAKNVILLYRREHERKASLLITGNTRPRCRLVPYATIGEVETFIRGGLLPNHPQGVQDLRSLRAVAMLFDGLAEKDDAMPVD
jgi:hypothetical protein